MTGRVKARPFCRYQPRARLSPCVRGRCSVAWRTSRRWLNGFSERLGVEGSVNSNPSGESSTAAALCAHTMLRIQNGSGDLRQGPRNHTADVVAAVKAGERLSLTVTGYRWPPSCPTNDSGAAGSHHGTFARSSMMAGPDRGARATRLRTLSRVRAGTRYWRSMMKRRRGSRGSQIRSCGLVARSGDMTRGTRLGGDRGCAPAGTVAKESRAAPLQSLPTRRLSARGGP
jgi:hypothetical protein